MRVRCGVRGYLKAFFRRVTRELGYTPRQGCAASDLASAATALYHIAAGGRWKINPTAQTHLAELARAVRGLIEAFESATVH